MMSATCLESTTVLGKNTRHHPIQGSSDRPEAWLRNAPVCPELGDYGMIHLGIVEACRPYRFIRSVTRATSVLACFGGHGKVLIDGEWRECGAGKTVLIPQHSAAGYFSTGDEPWKMVWICYQQPDNQCPVTMPSSPVLAEHDPTLLLHAVEGLRLECNSMRDAVCVETWLKLIHRMVLRFAQPWQKSDPLRLLWERVAAMPASNWTLESLTAEARCCSELLRQRCRQQLGRSPMQHVTYLRMKRAAELLRASGEKISAVAEQVGYRDADAFSVAFKKWAGCPPSEFRERL